MKDPQPPTLARDADALIRALTPTLNRYRCDVITVACLTLLPELLGPSLEVQPERTPPDILRLVALAERVRANLIQAAAFISPSQRES